MQQNDPHHVNYGKIFFGLCGLTVLSVLIDVAAMPSWELIVAILVLAVAAAKAGLVMLYFMHLKFERTWKYALLAPTIILSIGMILALFPDISLHYYPLDVPQVD